MAREIEWEPGLTLEMGPDAQLDYVIGFGKWLPPDQELQSYEVESDGSEAEGLYIVVHGREGDKIRVVLTGLAVGEEGVLTIKVETDAIPPIKDSWPIRFVGVEK